MARPTPEAINEPFRRHEEPERQCQREDCPESGLHRAPKSRHELNDYYWFCLDHVREYNLAWDYFVGLDEDEIEHQRRRDSVWERPSWPLGGSFHRAEERLRKRTEEAFDDGGGQAHDGPTLRSEDEKALAILDLKRPITFPEIKARYKKLVKQLHPDANGGDTAAEERLKTVNLAYSTLKRSFVQ